MPHYGLMDAEKMTEADAALMRSRLHLRGGKRRLQKGLSAEGLAALYDSILFGMRYYIAKHEYCASFVKNTDRWDAVELYHALARAGVFDDPLAFNRFHLIVERALWQGSSTFDADAALADVEMMLAKLGVMSFDESGRPGASRSHHRSPTNESFMYQHQDDQNRTGQV